MQNLEVKNITKRYKHATGYVTAVNDVSFAINPGEVFSILGPNGAGKTSLVLLMCGLLHPDQGSVWYGGNPILKRYQKYQRRIGAVLEGNRNIYWYLSAVENLKYFGRLLFLEDKVIKRKSEELLEFFDLNTVKNEPIGNFSRGMQQKVAISVAMINEPDILFLDEPTLGLDVITKYQMIEKLKDIAKTQGTTIVLTTHQLEVCEKLSGRILLLDKGKILHCQHKDSLKKLFAEKSYSLCIEGKLSENEKSHVSNIIDKKGTVQFIEDHQFTTMRIDLHQVNESRGIDTIISYLVHQNHQMISFLPKESSLEDIFINLFKKKGS